MHLGMTGAMLRCDGRPGAKAWEGIDALDEDEIKRIFEALRGSRSSKMLLV